MYLSRKSVTKAFLYLLSVTIFTLCVSVARAGAPAAINDYMAKMKSASGRFVQVGPDGVISTGNFALRKPGKMNFDYDPPTPLRVAADGFWTVVEDKRLKTQDRYPLSETPLKLILDDKTDYRNSSYITGFDENETAIRVNAADPKRPEIGSIQIIFTKSPMTLKQWVITDPQGLKTTVTLQNVVLNPQLPNRLFYIENSLKR